MAAVLLIVGTSTGLTTEDTNIKSRLETNLGHTVTIADDADAEVASGYALVIGAESCGSSTLVNKYRSSAMPYMALKMGVWGDCEFASIDGTTLATQTAVDLASANTGHALAAGLGAGTHTIKSAAATLGHSGTSTFGTGVIKVFTTTGSTTQFFEFAYESGASMDAGFIAPARRIALGWANVGGTTNATGWAIFDAAVNWGIGAAAPERGKPARVTLQAVNRSFTR